jgi:hypothetical protein
MGATQTATIISELRYLSRAGAEEDTSYQVMLH